MFNNFLTFSLVYRLRWYRNEMLNKLIRYKHGLIIIIALLVPSFHALSWLTLLPIRQLVAHSTSLELSFISLLGIQALFISWAAIQKQAILSASFIRSYFCTLPIKSSYILQMDLLLLQVANLILWVPFVLVFFGIKSEAEFTRFLILISGIVISQMIFLYQKFPRFIGIFFSNLFFILSSIANSSWLSFVLMVMSCSMLFICLLPKHYFEFLSINSFRKLQSKYILLSLNLPFEGAVLIRHYTFPVLVRLFFLLLIAALGCILLKYSALSMHYWGGLQCFMTLNTFVGSALYTLLHEARRDIRPYLKTLPYNELYWNIREYVMGSVSSFSVSILFLYVLRSLANLSILQCMKALMAQVPLQFLLYFVRTRYEKQGTFISLIISVAWIVLLIMCVDKGYI